MKQDSIKELKVQDTLKKNFKKFKPHAIRNIRSASLTNKTLIEKFKDKITEKRQIALNQDPSSIEELETAEKNAQYQYESIRDGKNLHISSINQRSLLKQRRKHINLRIIPDIEQSPEQDLRKHAKRPPRAKVVHNINQLKTMSYHRGLTYTVQISEVKRYLEEIKQKNQIERVEEDGNQASIQIEEDIHAEVEDELVNFTGHDHENEFSKKMLDDIRESIVREDQENMEENLENQEKAFQEFLRKQRVNIKKLLNENNEEGLLQMNEKRKKMLQLVQKKDFKSLKAEFTEPD